MKITLNIKDSKASAFINFIKSLYFVRVENNQGLSCIKASLKEVEKHNQGKVKLQTAQEFLAEL